MADRTRYRSQARGAARSGWAEWGPFLLALAAGAWLLFVLAQHSPVFTVPKALPATGAVEKGGGGSAEQSGGKEPQGSHDQPE